MINSILDAIKNVNQEDIEKLRLLMLGSDSYSNMPNIKIEDFFVEYIKHVSATKSKSYARSVKISFDHFCAYFPQQRILNTIKLKEIEDFTIHLQNKVSKGYVVYFRNLKAAFNKAVSWGYVKNNYFEKVYLKKRQFQNPLFITYHELNVILTKTHLQHLKEVFIIAFFTGMRLNEIINLKWSNIDLSKKTIRVGDNYFITKSKKTRVIPICDDLFDVLVKKETSKSSNKDLLFVKSNGTCFTGDYFSKRFKKACLDAGLSKELHFHCLRHSFASALAQKDVSLYVVKDLLGHSSILTTEMYSHLTIDSLKKAIYTFNKI